MSRLEELIAELEKVAGPSRDFDWSIAQITNLPEVWPETASWPPFMAGSKFDKAIPLFTASLDAAVALVERVLPGAKYEITTTGFKPGCTIVVGGKVAGGAYAATAVLAITVATLRPKLAQEEA